MGKIEIKQKMILQLTNGFSKLDMCVLYNFLDSFCILFITCNMIKYLLIILAAEVFAKYYYSKHVIYI